MKKLLCFFMLFFIANVSYSQGVNLRKTTKINGKIVSLYEKKPFTGVRFVKINRKNFLVCVIEVNNTASTDLDRLTKLKAMQSISEFLNGANIVSASSLVLEETTKSNTSTSGTDISSQSQKEYISKMIDRINTNSQGFVNGIESVENREKGTNKIYFFVKQIK